MPHVLLIKIRGEILNIECEVKDHTGKLYDIPEKPDIKPEAMSDSVWDFSYTLEPGNYTITARCSKKGERVQNIAIGDRNVVGIWFDFIRY